MPRPAPSLRRTVSTPSVRPRASSNPYPPMLAASSRSNSTSVVASVVVAGASTSPASPSFPPTSAMTRARRGNSTSSSSGSYECTRRVLQDITWCYDGQMQSSAPIIVADQDAPIVEMVRPMETETSSSMDFNIEDDMERLSLGASNALEGSAAIIEEDESSIQLLDGESDADLLAPLRVGTPEIIDTPHAFVSFFGDRSNSMPSSTESSPGRPRRGAHDLGFGFTIDFTKSFSHNRREASYSSTCSDFEDHVPSPTYF